MTTDLQRYFHTAVRAAEAAARIHRAHHGQALDIDTKSSDTDLVTEVDKKSEARIRDIISAAHPEHVVLGEEQGQPGGEASHRWIVDPLDGTSNYAHGFPFYCVSIALEIDRKLMLGIIYDSFRNEMFSAVRGEGAALNGHPISVSRETELSRTMLATGFAYKPNTLSENVEVFARMLGKTRAIRRPGAAALDLAYVASGRLDGFWELKLNAWDVAAGIVIIEEAGGRVSDAEGNAYALDDKIIVASNGHIHDPLVQALALDNLAHSYA